MITQEDAGKTVIIRARDEFYSFVDGWNGILEGIDNGYGAVRVADVTVDCGYKMFLVPPDQLEVQL
jgi:hypothetical protein